MATVIVRRLCRQRRSHVRKQHSHIPPLYQDTRVKKQQKMDTAAILATNFNSIWNSEHNGIELNERIETFITKRIDWNGHHDLSICRLQPCYQFQM